MCDLLELFTINAIISFEIHIYLVYLNIVLVFLEHLFNCKQLLYGDILILKPAWYSPIMFSVCGSNLRYKMLVSTLLYITKQFLCSYHKSVFSLYLCLRQITLFFCSSGICSCSQIRVIKLQTAFVALFPSYLRNSAGMLSASGALFNSTLQLIFFWGVVAVCNIQEVVTLPSWWHISHRP